MTAPSRFAALAAAAALSLSLAACAADAPGADPVDTSTPPAEAVIVVTEGPCASDEGVTVIVDPGSLAAEEAPASTHCVATDTAIAAAEAFELVGVTTEGTAEYGDMVVCRVNGVPAADTVLTADDGTEYTESCESMPAAFAYWSLWLAPADGEWGYANEGLSTQQVAPGESIALLFVLNGEPAAPVS